MRECPANHGGPPRLDEDSRFQEGKLEAAAEKIHAGTGATVSSEIVDLSDEGSVEALISRLGERTIDILVNNGGGPPPGSIAAVTPETWRGQFEGMLNAPFAITAGPEMRAT